MALMVLTPLETGEIGQEYDTCPFCKMKIRIYSIGGYKTIKRKVKCPRCGGDVTIYTSIQ